MLNSFETMRKVNIETMASSQRKYGRLDSLAKNFRVFSTEQGFFLPSDP